MGIGDIWNLVALQPMTNVLIVLSHYLFSNFGLAIIALTIIVNGLMLPLTLKQIRATKAMQGLQPKLTELQKKYVKDRQKLAQEQMKLYKESGLSPAGCLVPLVIQMPIWIALYQSIIRALAVTPESLADLSGHLYSWPVLNELAPLGSRFLWINLAEPDHTLLLPLLVGASMWVQQKMIATPSQDPRQQSMTSMMQWMMPLMFTVFSLSFPAGLALYWLFSNLIGIAIQYFITGWGGLAPVAQMFKRRLAQQPQAAKGK